MGPQGCPGPPWLWSDRVWPGRGEGTLGWEFHARLALFTQAVVGVLPASSPSDCVLSVCRDSGSLARQLVPQWLKLNLLPQPEHVAPMLTDLLAMPRTSSPNKLSLSCAFLLHPRPPIPSHRHLQSSVSGCVQFLYPPASERASPRFSTTGNSAQLILGPTISSQLNSPPLAGSDKNVLCQVGALRPRECQ